MKYRKKPVVIDAVQWNVHNTKEVLMWITGGQTTSNQANETNANKLTIHTLEGDLDASSGDYIIKGIKGEFYPCKPDIFEQTYEKAGE